MFLSNKCSLHRTFCKIDGREKCLDVSGRIIGKPTICRFIELCYNCNPPSDGYFSLISNVYFEIDILESPEMRNLTYVKIGS